MTMATAPTTSTYQQLIAIPMEQYNQLMSLTNAQQPIDQKLVRLQNELTHSSCSGSKNEYDQMMRQGMGLEEVLRTKE